MRGPRLRKRPERHPGTIPSLLALMGNLGKRFLIELLHLLDFGVRQRREFIRARALGKSSYSGLVVTLGRCSSGCSGKVVKRTFVAS